MLIKIRSQSNAYVATVDDGEPYLGHSPDEALGYAIRETWLAGDFEQPVKITLDIQSDVPYKSGK